MMRKVAAKAAFALSLAGNFRGVCSVYKPGGKREKTTHAKRFLELSELSSDKPRKKILLAKGSVEFDRFFYGKWVKHTAKCMFYFDCMLPNLKK